MKSDKNSSSAAPAGRSFRLVCPACRIPQVEELLRAQGYEFEPEPFSPWCRRLLAEPRPLGASLAAFFGYIYIQDRSSMLPPLALAPAEGAAVLDMCASPGSKTGFLAQLVGPEGFVLGNEPSRARLATLRANLHACNWPHAATCSYEGQALPLTPESWDWIQLDPPCSGWGTVEKNPQVLTLWQGDKVKTLVGLQQMLLAHAARLLRPGGRLVYSTCTTNDEENEAQVRYAEEELGLRRLPLEPFDGFVWENRPGGEGTLRVNGEKSGAQGFYVALFTKDASAACDDARDGAAEGKTRAAADWRATGRPFARERLRGPCFDPDLLPPGDVMLFGDQLRLVPPQADVIPPACRWQGGLLGRIGKRGFVPAPRLRLYLPGAAGDAPAGDAALVLEDVDDITALLNGQSRRTGLAGTEAALWWRNLPLGRVALKQGRVLAAFG